MNVATLARPSNGVKATPKAKEPPAQIERERMVAWLAERLAASQKEPVTEIVTLTPVLAQLLLDRNKENRPVSEVALDRMKRDIEGGRWEFNGETIIVAKDGSLNNGQHRCRAVVETGKSIKAILVFGPERQSRMTVDTGTTRTVGHFLQMNGYHDTNSLAAAAGMIWQHRNQSKLSSNGKTKPTKAESLLVVSHFQDLTDSINFVSRKGAGAIASKAMLAFAHWSIWKTAGQHLANEFLDKLIEGNELKKDNPILYCRNRLIEMRGTARQGDKAELIFRAWNLWRRGDKATRIPVLGRLPTLEA